MPGVVKFTNIVMKRGVSNSTHLFAWWKKYSERHVRPA